MYKSGYEQNWLDPDWEVGYTTLRQLVNPNLEDLLPGPSEELRWIIPQAFGTADDWTLTKIFHAYKRIAYAIIGRMFFGPGLSRDKDLLKITFEGEIDLYAVAYEIAKWPLLLRPLASKLLPRARALKQNYREIAQFLEPVLKKRLQTSSSGQEEKPSGRPSDFMQWMLGCVANRAMHTPTAMPATSGYCDGCFLCDKPIVDAYLLRPGHVPRVHPALREEFEDKIARPKDITRATLANMGKLDSIMKESHRMSPQAVVSMERNITGPIQLSSGVTLQPRLRIAFPTPQQGLDPQIGPDPT